MTNPRRTSRGPAVEKHWFRVWEYGLRINVSLFFFIVSCLLLPFVRASLRPSVFHKTMLTEDSSCPCSRVVQSLRRFTLNKHSRVEQCTVCIEPCLVDEDSLIDNRLPHLWVRTINMLIVLGLIMKLRDLSLPKYNPVLVSK